jgi:hypothetical protein
MEVEDAAGMEPRDGTAGCEPDLRFGKVTGEARREPAREREADGGNPTGKPGWDNPEGRSPAGRLLPQSSGALFEPIAEAMVAWQ